MKQVTYCAGQSCPEDQVSLKNVFDPCRWYIFFLLLQSTGTLPRPVMYIQPKDDDDDEIKTNPDLFSDTNSNRGSQATVEDGMFPIPDSASEASVDVGVFKQPVKPVQFRQRLNKHELDVSVKCVIRPIKHFCTCVTKVKTVSSYFCSLFCFLYLKIVLFHNDLNSD